MSSNALRVLVVDDSATYRKIVNDSLRDLATVQVIGTANATAMAVTQIDALKPDLVTLDWELPGGGGPEVLQHIQGLNRSIGVVVLSGCEDRAVRNKALELGAFDFVLKPDSTDPTQNSKLLCRSLAAKFSAYVSYLEMTGELPKAADPRTETLAAPECAAVSTGVVQSLTETNSSEIDLVVIGISTGGPHSLHEFLPKLPKNFAAPIVVAQHMSAGFTRDFANDLNSLCELEVVEGCDGQPLKPGQVVICPGSRQTEIESHAVGLTLKITHDCGGCDCCPSVDRLFTSAAQAAGSRTLAIIMTGMGNDGSAGCRQLKQHGATILAQDEASCVVFGMPAQPIAEGLADAVVSLPDMAWETIRHVGRNL